MPISILGAVLGDIFGGAAAAAPVAAGAADLGTLAGTSALIGGADIAGPTALGTAEAFLDPAAAAAASGAGAVGPTALGTAGAFLDPALAAGAAEGGLTAAAGGAAGGLLGAATPSSIVASDFGTLPLGADTTTPATLATGTQATTGAQAAAGPVGAAGNVPGGAGLAGTSAPTGAAPIDLTASQYVNQGFSALTGEPAAPGTLPTNVVTTVNPNAPFAFQDLSGAPPYEGSTETLGAAASPQSGVSPLSVLNQQAGVATPTTTPSASLDQLAAPAVTPAATPTAAPVTAPAAAPATPAAAATPATDTGIGGQISSFVKAAAPYATVAAPVLGLGGLGYSIYNQKTQEAQAQATINSIQQQEQQTVAAANAAAAPTLQEGQTLVNYLATGTLPASVQAQLTQAVAAAKANAISNAASQGLSTDPTKNTALATTLANIDQQALSEQGTLQTQLEQAGNQLISTADTLISSGLQATQISAQLQEYLLNLDATLSQNTGTAIANFAASLAPTKALKLQIGA